MIYLTIYINQKFAILRNDFFKITIKVYENNSYWYTYKSKTNAFQRKYKTIEELLLDNDLSDTDKWIAKGLQGIPTETKNDPQR